LPTLYLLYRKKNPSADPTEKLRTQCLITEPSDPPQYKTLTTNEYHWQTISNAALSIKNKGKLFEVVSKFSNLTT
jgi:hypothetical protein